MKDFTFCKRIALVITLLCSLHATAQLTLDFGVTPEQAAQNLVGVGVEIFNVEVTAAPGSWSYYNAVGTELGTSEGILLTTGQASNALGPNNSTGLPTISGGNCLDCDLYDNGFPGSPLLTVANGGLTTWDATTFEFDVVPQGDSIHFDFTFASEEYLEWVGSSFNDVFGFFVTGPNVGVDVNVALIPGTSTAVAINSVNHLTNTQYFYNNQNPLGQFIEYDGFTVGIAAAIGDLIPCEVYHIKLIIADGSDRLYDSAVFVNTISSNPITITTSTVGGTEFMVEGCNDGTVEFQSTFVPNNDLPVNFTLSGSAVFGVDFTTNPDLNLFYDSDTEVYTLFIPAGETSISFDILPIGDGLLEGEEVITISLIDQLCEGFQFQSAVDFSIIDELEVDITPSAATICNGQCVTLTGTALQDGSSSFAWSPVDGVSDPSSLVVEVCPTTTTTYTLTSTLANCEVSASATVTVTEPSIVFDVTNVTCIDGSTGEIAVTILDGTPPYNYSWTFNGAPFSNDGDLTGLAEGTYCLTIIDAVGCTTTACTDVIEEDVLTIVDFEFSQFTCSPISCSGACDASISITVDGGTGIYSYVWLDVNSNVVGSTSQATNLCAGTYTVTVNDELGCEVIGIYTIVEPQPLEIQVEGTVDILCSGEETGLATVTSTGGCAPYFYNWSHDPNLSSPIATNLGAGIYEVTVTDANGCTSAGSVTIVINEPGAPISATVESISVYPGGFNVSCPDASDGNVDLSIAGGTPGYFVTWIHVQSGNTYFTEDLANVACGTYNLTIVDANGCEFTDVVELTCVPAWNVSAVTVPNPCGAPEAGLGEISLTVAGSHGGPYTVEWTGPSCPCSGTNLTNLDSGDYIATITDVLGCETTFTVNVGTNDEFVVTPTITNADCGGVCTGSIELAIVTGEATTVVWSGPNGFASTDEDIFNLCAGSYTVTVTAGDCEESFTYSVGEPTPIEINFIDVVPPICFGQNNGSVTANATGGIGILTYEWLAEPSCFFAGSNQAEITNLFDCVYTVIVTDETGCTAQASIDLDAPQVMDIFVSTTNFDGGYNVSCFGANDGQISVTVSGGTPDCIGFDPECYNFDWSSCDAVNVPGSSFQGNLTAGTYCVLVTDANGCVATTQIPIIQPDPIQSSGAVSNYNGFGVSCEGACDGFITPNITGGSGNYIFYSWSAGDIGANAPNAETLTDLCPGVYTLQVIDTNGCEDFIDFEITEPTAIDITLDAVINVTCYEGSDGAISVSATGGAGGYNFVWNSGAYNGNIIAGLPAGIYNLVVTDANGCSEELTVEITEPAPFLANLTVPAIEGSEFDIPCFGDETGSIITLIEGGTPNYDIIWSGVGITDPFSLNQQNLPAGTYTITVTDAEGCEITESVTITAPEFPLEVTATVSNYASGFEISCFGACDGFIDLTVTGGVAPYTFLWEVNDDGGEFALTEDIQDLCPGIYEVLVSDANGCDELLSFTIEEPEPIAINPTLSDFDGFNVSCAGACDGSIEIAPSGGVPDYTIAWLVNGEDLGSGSVLNDLCGGDVVEVTITDAAGCEQSQTFIITEPDSIVLDATVSNISCTGETDGSIVVNVSGGAGGYTYTWTPDLGSGASLNNLEAGTYCLQVTDANGCSVEECWEIIEPTELTATITGTPANCGACDGLIVLTLTGGTTPYSIAWSGPTAVPDDVTLATELCAGVYSIAVSDAAGCSLSFDFDLPGPDAIVIDPTVTQPLCYNDCDGAVSVSVQNGVAPYTYQWLDAAGSVVSTSNSIAQICEGSFTLLVTDADGCEQEATFSIAQPDSLTINGISPLFDNGFNVSTFNGNDGSISTEVTGGTPDYFLVWEGPTAIEDDVTDPNDLVAGQYTLTVTDANGCSKDTVIVLTAPDDLTLPTGISPNGDGANDTYVILGISEYPNNMFKVFNRWGNIVYEKQNYANEWAGTNNDNEALPDGTYFIIFEASERQFATYVDLRR